MLMLTMSRLLSELLGANEPMFSAVVEKLERASGQQSADVRLSAEIVAKVHARIRALGLDPHDTNGPELYHALLDMVRLHDQFLAKVVGGDDPADVADLLPRIVHVAGRIRMPRQVWAMKHSAAKRLLKAHPPRKVMRALGYRSVDSILKREPVGVIFGALRFTESPQWLEQFVHQYSKLNPSDFEVRPIEIFRLDTPKWIKASESFVRQRHHNITHSKEAGSILVLPLPVAKLAGITMAVLPLLLHYINELRIYSAFFKIQQVKPDFGEIIAHTLLHDPGGHAVIASQPVHWRVIHKHFGNQPPRLHPELFEPHVQPEDLQWRQVEEILFHLEPALQFWQGMDYVGLMKDGQRISFNLMDMAVNFVNQLPYEKQVSYHLRNSLENELFLRYMGQPALESQILRQLDNDLVESEFVPVGALTL